MTHSNSIFQILLSRVTVLKFGALTCTVFICRFVRLLISVVWGGFYSRKGGCLADCCFFTACTLNDVVGSWPRNFAPKSHRLQCRGNLQIVHFFQTFGKISTELWQDHQVGWCKVQTSMNFSNLFERKPLMVSSNLIL